MKNKKEATVNSKKKQKLHKNATTIYYISQQQMTFIS